MAEPATCSDCGARVSKRGRKCLRCAHVGVRWSAAQHTKYQAFWTEARRADAAKATRARLAKRPPRPAKPPRPQRVISARAWTGNEDRILRELAGKLTIAELAAAVSVDGVPRSEDAIRCRAWVLGLDISAPGLTVRGVAQLFNVGIQKAYRWISEGLIAGAPAGEGKIHTYRSFRDDDIRRFIRDHPLAYDWTKIRDRRWRSEAQVVAQTHGWIPVARAAEWLKISSTTFHDHLIKTGRLETQTGPHPSRRSWQFYVRRSDVQAIVL